MHDQIEAVVQKLTTLQSKFNPATLSYGGSGPENTLTLDHVNAIQEAAEELRSVRGSLVELIGVIDECNPARMEELAESDKIQAVASFNLDAYQRDGFEKIDHGDEEKLDANQDAASGQAIDKLNDLVEDAKPELQELHQLVEDALKQLGDAT